MLGKILKGISGSTRTNFSRSLKNNHHNRNNSWNLPERLQVYCSTHYLKAMFFLWVTACTAVLAAEYLRPLLLPFAQQHFTGITGLVTWMSSLLGSQVTLIGIVFPLVVGLISVLFQKKSSRIHIQSAYQLHSGYMFAGLSGLSLAGFILLEGLFLARGDKYLNTAFAVTAFIWMLFNILLSIWFFITSLNVLDDEKRERLMLKYFHSQIVSVNLQASLVRHYIRYPGLYLGKDKIGGITVMPYYTSHGSQEERVFLRVKKNQTVIDIYMRPLLFLLRQLKKNAESDSSITLLPQVRHKKGEITLMSFSGIKPSRVWVVLFRLCFRKGTVPERPLYKNIAHDFYGEVYDTLDDKNIGAFEQASERLVATFTSIKNGFRHNQGGNYIDECETLDEYITLSKSFYFCFSNFCRDAVKTVETSVKYYRKVMDIPSSVYHRSEDRTIADYEYYNQSLFSVWYALINWKAGLGENVSVSQSQRHRELVIDFIGSWEFWNRWITRVDESEQDDYSCRLLQHLCFAPQIVMAAATADDLFATEHSTDMLLLWLSQTRLESDFESEHRWHSTLLTPTFMELKTEGPEWEKMLRGSVYSEKAALSVIFDNALRDIRLLTAGYFLTYLKPEHVPVNETVKRLLKSELAYSTGAYDRMSAAFSTATDIIDSIIRIEYRSENEKSSWYTRISGIVNTISSYNDRQQVSGRIYMGAVEDARSLYGSYVAIAVMLSDGAQTVSRKISDALKDNLFSYHNKMQILHLLQCLRYDPDKPPVGELITKAQYDERGIHYNETLDAYIQAFSQKMNSDILQAEIDYAHISQIVWNLTDSFPNLIAENALLSRFTLTYKDTFNSPVKTMKLRSGMNKELIAKDINSHYSGNLMSSSDIKSGMLNHVYSTLSRLPVSHIEDINDVDMFCKRIGEMTADCPDCTVMIFGTRFGRELQDLVFQKDRHDALGISMITSSRTNGALPFRIHNCTVWQVWGDETDCTLLVENSSFGSLRMFRYPDGSLFTIFWQSRDENPLEGTLTTLWDPEMDITGSVMAKFFHR
ncbi:hypothetical protein ACIPT4_19320 [Pectobacterium jejuense]|uniref:hypothetical protein n=1 Tax=Pectobacterium jejuense TaxID=2974022 RepID=UPI0038269C1D